MTDEKTDDIDHSQLSKQELYGFLDKELSPEARKDILGELSKHLKSSFEDAASEASKPPNILRYKRPIIGTHIGPLHQSGRNIYRNNQNSRGQIIVIILAVVLGMGMLMAVMKK